MAEKVSTLVVTLNHGCCSCFTKIRKKTLCKLQDTEDIRTISYDEVSGTVMISGAFDPLVLPWKLRRKVGFLIRDIQLVAAELRLTAQPLPPPPPPLPVQRPMMLPNPSSGLAALAPSCCSGMASAATYGGYGCRVGGHGGYGCCYCGCQAFAFLNHPPGYYGELPLGQYPKSEVPCDCEQASPPAYARSCEQ